ncbi:ion transporter [Halococcus sp. IIIV-5B]|uniref:ion transporter n=1 Tax=Halococcus sp. IIIV-5B TaxID=2321230 RepID=UPI000E71E60B|nr:ion transporter [Halococcus sp. IIIV-5B]RJS97447.1 ion transporter [Halococcus sp. IIIV-5B]
MVRIGSGYRAAKRTTHRLLTVGKGGRVAGAVDVFIAGLIVANLVAVALGTVDPVFDRYRGLLYRFNAVSVGVFTVEYGLRVWSATAVDGYDHPVFGRLRFMARPECLVDLLAIAPFYVGIALFGGDGRLLRGFRLVRFFRLAKLVRYTDSVARFERVLRRKTDDLVVALGGTTLLVVCSSSLLYFVEHEAQPEAFSSIPAALWWGVVTLTTVGYGDVYPVTPLGKLLGGLVAVLGTGLVALPASILASGFIHDDTEPSRCPHCGEAIE